MTDLDGYTNPKHMRERHHKSIVREVVEPRMNKCDAFTIWIGMEEKWEWLTISDNAKGKDPVFFVLDDAKALLKALAEGVKILESYRDKRG